MDGIQMIFRYYILLYYMLNSWYGWYSDDIQILHFTVLYVEFLIWMVFQTYQAHIWYVFWE